MKLNFSKMHGLGNDFVVLDAINQSVDLNPKQIASLADRRFGIGCDQVLLVEPARSADTDFYYHIYNADGSEAEQCGNGARCFARFVIDKGLTRKQTIDVGTAKGAIQLIVESDGQIKVNMGSPVLEPTQIPFIAKQQQTIYTLESNGQQLQIGAVSMGNPHAVLLVDDVATAKVDSLGPALEFHPDFPQKVNVGFMQVLDPGNIRLRVYERGTGETLACGSGACAAVVAGQLRDLLNEEVRVHLSAGTLLIRWNGANNPVWMTGSATTVFEGSIEL